MRHCMCGDLMETLELEEGIASAMGFREGLREYIVKVMNTVL